MKITIMALALSCLALPLRAELADPGAFLDTDLAGLEAAAVAEYRAGRYQQAADAFLAALEHDIQNSGLIYNLACCYGLMGKDTLASRNLIRSARAGYDALTLAERDGDFNRVRNSPAFKEAVDSIQRISTAKASAPGHSIAVPCRSLNDCLVRLPAGYDSTARRRLVLGLHGFGGNPEKFLEIWDRFEKPDFILAALRAPYLNAPGREPGFGWTLASGDSSEYEESVRLSEDYIAEAVRGLQRSFQVSEVYLMGFSQGGYMAYNAALRYPDLFDGVMCFGGEMDSARVSGLLGAGKKWRAFVAHSPSDGVVEFVQGVKANRALKKNGYPAIFHEYQGGHALPAPALKAAQAWMAKTDKKR